MQCNECVSRKERESRLRLFQDGKERDTASLPTIRVFAVGAVSLMGLGSLAAKRSSEKTSLSQQTIKNSYSNSRARRRGL